jgi:hypothetical protein
VAETKKEKAARYLAEGRVRLDRVDATGPRFVFATVRGDSGTHSCGYDPTGGGPAWRCTCDAWKLSASHPDCSHLTAVKLLVERPAS